MSVLGLTHPVGADCSACLVAGDEFVGLYEEERFSRQKHALNAMPYAAMRQLMADAAISSPDQYAAGFTRPTHRIFSSPRLQTFLGDLRGTFDFHDKKLCALGAPLEHVEHYLAHAWSVVPYVHGRDANILLLDGWGGDAAGAAMSLSANGEMRELWRVPVEFSLGLFYQAVTSFLGFAPHADEGKTMGLSAYGDLDETLLPDFCDRGTRLPDVAKYLEHLDGLDLRRRSAEPILQAHKNIARTAQHYLEQAVLQSAHRMFEETRCGVFALAGGVALNCVANGKLANAAFVDEVVVHPASNDAGVAMGAALAVAASTRRVLADFPREHAYLGPRFSTASVEGALKFAKLEAVRDGSPEVRAAEALCAGKVVGIYSGRAEIGPRALGARSILADPRTAAMRDRVNGAVKKREAWRPFAPAVLEGQAPQIFGAATPFMTVADTVAEAWRERIPAVVHVDGTARAQIIPSSNETLFARTVREFYQRTGVPVLLNTSFNHSDEPIVHSPGNAIATFYRTGLDMLVFDCGYLCKRVS